MNARKAHRAPAPHRRSGQRPPDPDEWATGNQPMTSAQAKYLRLLCEEAGAAFEARLTKAQASRRIDCYARTPVIARCDTRAGSTKPPRVSAGGGALSQPSRSLTPRASALAAAPGTVPRP